MKTSIAAVALLSFLLTASTVFGGGHYYGNHGYHSGHHGSDLGIVLGVAGGLVLGSALVYAAQPPQPVVVYQAPPYQPAPVVPAPRTCFEDRLVYGEWQVNTHDGRQVWVPYSSPVNRRVQVPCY